MREIEIRLNAVGFGKVFLDGVDITNGIKSIDIHHEAGHVPQVTLTYISKAVCIQCEKANIIADEEE